MITSEAGNIERLHMRKDENAWQKTTRATNMWRTRTAQAGEVEGCEQRRGSIERHERLLVRLVQPTPLRASQGRKRSAQQRSTQRSATGQVNGCKQVKFESVPGNGT